jgi:cobalt-zinc-cadmium efflux system protein
MSMSNFDSVKKDLRHRLEHLEIQHSTFEPELADDHCTQTECTLDTPLQEHSHDH